MSSHHRRLGCVLGLIGAFVGLVGPRAAAQGRGFELQFGVVQPQHEALRQWVAASPVLKGHLQRLGQQLDLPVAIPVVFLSCGQANAFFRPDLKQINMCFEWIEQRRDQVQNRAQEGEKLTDAVLRGVEHVINHESGHALMHVLQLPVLEPAGNPVRIDPVSTPANFPANSAR